MDKLTDPNFWHDNWEVVRNAPWIVIPLLLVAGLVGWFFRSSQAKSSIEGLREQVKAKDEQIKIQEARRCLAEESERKIAAEIPKLEATNKELEAQIKNLPALAQTTGAFTQSFTVIANANSDLKEAVKPVDGIYNSAGGTANRPMDLEKR